MRKRSSLGLIIAGVTVLALFANSPIQAAAKKGTLKMASADMGIEIELNNGPTVTVPPGKDVAFPAGTYTVKSFALLSKKNGKVWKLKSTGALGKLQTFTVNEDETTTIDVGPPLTLQPLAMPQRDGQTISIGISLRGKSGEFYIPGAFVGTQQMPAPKFQIESESGKVLAAGQFEYG
jgi:hypothetical protein